jgi:hypothetical protein
MYTNETEHSNCRRLRYRWEGAGHAVPYVEQEDGELLGEENEWLQDHDALRKLSWSIDRNHYVKIALDEASGTRHNREVCDLCTRLSPCQRV